MKAFKKICLYLSVIIFVMLVNTALFAQEKEIKAIQFSDGSVVQGKVIEMNAEIIKVKTKTGKTVIRLFDDIVSVEDYVDKKKTAEGKASFSKTSYMQATPKLFTEFGLKTKYIHGDATYHISFPGGASELEFPYDNFMAGITLAVGSKYTEKPKQIKGLLNLSLLYSPTMDSGTFKDSDWTGSVKTHYTESDAESNGIIFDVNYAYHFSLNNNWTLGPMVGYKYMDFNFDIYGARGTYPSGPVSISGKVLEYDIHCQLPYIGLSSNLLFGREDQFQLNFIFGYSPWAKVKDRDDHILRYKLSEGDCDGHAYLVDINIDWNFYSNWTLGLGAEYVDIDTSGKQHQSFYAGPYAGWTADIDDEITSSYWSAMLRISYAFF